MKPCQSQTFYNMSNERIERNIQCNEKNASQYNEDVKHTDKQKHEHLKIEHADALHVRSTHYRSVSHDYHVGA